MTKTPVPVFENWTTFPVVADPLTVRTFAVAAGVLAKVAEDEVRVVAFIMAALPLVKTFRVAMFASVRTVKLVALAVAAFMVVTLVVERLEFPVTFKFVPKIEDVTLSVPVTLVVERFEFPVTFKFPPKIEDAFRVVTLVVERLEFPATFTVVQKTKGIVSVL
jgi:hypothetical protein